LTLTSGASVVTSLTLSGNYAGSSFFLSPTVNGATSISVVAGPPLPTVTLFGPALVGLGQDVVVGSVTPVAVGDRLALVIDALPRSGTLLLLADGSIHYLAPAGQAVGLAFHVTDQAGRSSGLQAASITVNPGPLLRPVAVVIAAGQGIDLSARLHALALPGMVGDVLTIRAVSGGAGSVSLAGGTLRYVGNGAADSFTYTLADQLGNVATATVRVLSPAAARAGITVAAALAPGAVTDATTVVSDTAAAVAAGLDGLAALAAAGRLAAIGLLDGGQGVLAITPGQALVDIGALALVATPHALVQHILAADAATAVLAAGFAGFAVVDSAAGLLAALNAVAALGRQGRLTQIVLTGSGAVPILSLSAAQLAAGIDALAWIATPFTIALIDAGTPEVAVPGWQLGLVAVVLARITTPHIVSVTSAVRAATVAGMADLPGSLTVLDDTSSIADALGLLESAAQAGKLASIQLRGPGPQVLSLTAAQLTNAANVIAKLSSNRVLSQVITAAEAASPVLDPRFTSFTVRDTNLNLMANLDSVDALARGGELVRVQTTEAATYLTVTAAQFGRDVVALSLLAAEGGVVIRLSDGGTPPIVVAADLLGSSAVRMALNAIADPFSLVLAGSFGAGAAAAVVGENGRVLASLAVPLDVFDTAAGIAANLTGLATLLARGRLGVITLHDGGALPVLNISPADAIGFTGVLAHIASPFAVAGFFGSAANFMAQIAGLQSLAVAQPGVSYALSNAGTPVLTLTAATLAANLLALSRIASPFSIALSDGGTPTLAVTGWQLANGAIVAVLGKLTATFTLLVTDVLDASAAANLAPLAARLSTAVAVLDTGAAIAANLPALNLLAAAGRLANITLLEGQGTRIVLTASQADANAAALALVNTPHTLVQLVDAAAVMPSPGFGSLAVHDTAAAVLANLAGLQALANAGVLASITLTDGAALNLTAASLQANAAALSRIDASRLTLTDVGTPSLTFDAGALNGPALRAAVLERVTSVFSLTVQGVTDSGLAAALASSAKLLGSLAAPLMVMDTAAAVVANLAALQQLAAAGRLGSVRLTDVTMPSLALSPADLATYAAALAQIVTPFITASPVQVPVSLTASGLLAQLGALQAQAAAGILGVVTLTDGGTPTLAMSAGQFSAASLALAHVAGSFAITLTDAGTPTLQLSGIRAGLFAHVATPFQLTVAGPVDAATVAAVVAAGLTGRLGAALTVADHGSAIAAHLDALQLLAQAGRLGAVAIQDDNPVLALTAAQLAADAAALSAISAPYRLSLVTSAADAVLTAPFASVTVRDSAANVLAALAILAPLAAGGRLDSIELTGSGVLGLMAATLSTAAAVLSHLSGSYSIVLLDAGTPGVVLPGDLLSDAAVRRAVLDRISSVFTLTVTGAVSAATAAAVLGESSRVPTSLATGLVVLDSAAAVVANLVALEALAVGNRLQAIDLTDPGVASLRLTAAQAAMFSHALARITAPYVAGVAGDRLFLTAAGLLGQLETLQAQAAGGFLTHIDIIDATAPVLAMTAARLAADALALGLIATPFSVALTDAGPVVLHLTGAQAANAGIVAMLRQIATAFTLVVDGPMGAGAAVALGQSAASRLAAPLAVTDSAAGIAANLDGLQALAVSGLLGAVVLADAPAALAVTQATATADAAALAAITSPFTLSLITIAAGAAAVLTGRFTTLTVRDTAAAIIANLPALEVLAATGVLAGVQATDTAALSLSAATVAAGIDALAAGGFHVTLTDAAVPTIHIAAWQVDAAVLAALNRITGAYVLVVDGALRAVDAVRFAAVGGAALSNLQALSLQVSDDAAALSPAMLTSLQAMAGKIASLDLRAPHATLSLTPTQAAGFATILSRITSPHVLSQTVTAAGLGSATLAAGFASFTVADTAANIVAALPQIQAKAAAGLLGRLQPADGSMFSLNGAALNASLEALAAINHGAFPIVLTDAEAPVVIVPAGLLGPELRHVLDAIVSPFQLRIAGALDAGTAAAMATESNHVLANLTGQPDVADTAAAIGRALDGLQVLARLGHLGGVMVLGGGAGPITMTAAQFVADADALSHLTGSYSFAIIGARAADAAVMAARARVARVSVLDSAANVTARLEALQVLAQDGKLEGVAFTDPGVPALVLSLQRQAADADALLKIDVPYSLEVPVGNATGLDLGVQAYDWHSHALLSGVQLAVLGQGDRAGNISFRSVHLDGAGRVVAELWVDASGGVQSLGLNMTLPDGASAGFAGAAGFPSGWVVQTNTAAGRFSLQAIGTGSALAGLARVGTLTFDVPGSEGFSLDLTDGAVGGQAATPFSIAFSHHATGADGTAALTGVSFDSYAITATRSAADAGRATTAADALAALRIAVGLNPNSAPGGGMVPAPLVSPYQYLAADVNGDGRVTAADALAILRMAVKLPRALAPRWIFVDEAASYWDPVALKFASTRGSVGVVAVATAAVPNKMGVSLVGVLTGAVLGRWAPLDAAGRALTPDRYASLPTAYFQNLSAATDTPADRFGYAAAAGGTSLAGVKITAGNGLPTARVAVYDSAANIAASLDRLQTWHTAGRLQSLTFMETTTPIVKLSIAQFAADAGALSTATGIYRLDIDAGQNAASAAASGGSILSFVGTPDQIAIGSSAATIHYTLTPASGVATIANFRYDTDKLDIDLGTHATTDLLIRDVSASGRQAIAISAIGDGGHMVVLTGLAPAATSADLASQHLVILNGHALIG
jgi:hypothetical protein